MVTDNTVNTVPIIAGLAPDPTICAVGEDYYLANSSFEYFPGAPIFHSTDMVTWKQIGNIIDRPEQFEPGARTDSGGIYGSSLRFHDGLFWFVTTNMYAFMQGQLIFHAEDPAGPWSNPVSVRSAIGIDPDLTWDEEGVCHLTYKVPNMDPTGAGHAFIGQATVDPMTGELLSPVREVSFGKEYADTESPHLYKIGDWWYLLTAEGGTARGHLATVARSASPTGPFETSPYGPLLTHRSTEHPVQGTGHADLFPTADGSWAAVFLGLRPWGQAPGFHTIGRETFLTGIDWTDDGWPVVDEARYAVPALDHSFVDRFEAAPALGLQWVTIGGPLDFIEERRGTLSISTSGPSSTLLTRVRDRHWQIELELESVEGSGGAILRIDSSIWCEIRADAEGITAVAHLTGIDVVLGSLPGASSDLMLQITSVPAVQSGFLPATGPDLLRFAVDTGTGLRELGSIDGRYLSTEVAGGFTGRMVGIVVHTGTVDVARFTYTSR